MFRSIVAIVAGLGLAASSPAAMLLVQGGKLVGARHVDVGGKLYDVTFSDGTCTSVFGGCSDRKDFAFGTAQEAFEASLALIRQVFVDGPSGAFDSDYALTFGCETNSVADGSCSAYIPYYYGFPNFYAAQIAGNTDAVADFAAAGDDFIGASGGEASFDTRSRNWIVWARFEATGVPESATWAMMLGGFGAIGFVLRQRKGKAIHT